MNAKINVLRLPEVIKKTGRSRSSIYADVKLGKFPKPISLGERAIGWIESEIEEWLHKRTAESRKPSIN